MKYCLYFSLLCALVAAHPHQWLQAIELAERMQGQGKLAEARAALRQALDEAGAVEGREYRMAYTYDSLASVAQDEGEYLLAEQHYRRSLAHWQSAAPHAGMARTLNNLASLMHSAGKLREAEQLLLRSESMRGYRLDESDPESGGILLNHGVIYFAHRNYEKAEEAFRRARAIWEPHEKTRGWELGQAARDLAMVYERTGRKGEAARENEVARTRWEAHARATAIAPEKQMELAALYSAIGQLERAKLTAERAVSDAAREGGRANPRLAELLFHYAGILRQTGEKREAAQVEKRAKDLHAGSQGGAAGHTVDVRDLPRKRRQ
ncbi:MAG: tetratricopeptide repeat protein [Acidobacteria bacterium]|nr:tetratricopeptide repeat protein [Acidobacteriota bacterium]